MSLKLSEIFYSLQGEGPVTGHPAVFVRTAGCNLNCGQEPGAEWKCDTWDVMRSTKLELDPSSLGDYLESIVPGIAENSMMRIVFTGGEPFLQAKDILTGIKSLHKNFIYSHSRVDFETNGTVYNKDVGDILSMLDGNVILSPKLSNSHIPLEKRFNRTYLENIFAKSERAFLKLVVSSNDDLDEIEDHYIPILKKVFGPYYWREHIYLMPAMEDVPSMEIKQLVWKACMDMQIPMTMRAHIDTFGKRTGV